MRWLLTLDSSGCVSEGGWYISPWKGKKRWSLAKALTPCPPSVRTKNLFRFLPAERLCTALEQKSKTYKHFNLVSTAPKTGSHMKMESSWTHFHNYHAYHNSAPNDIKLSPSNTHLQEACSDYPTLPSDLFFHLPSMLLRSSYCIRELPAWWNSPYRLYSSIPISWR